MRSTATLSWKGIRMRPLKALVAAVLAALLIASSSAAAIAPVPVITGPGNQFAGGGNGTWFSLTANSTGHPNRYNAFAQKADGTGRVRLNATGTRGVAGNFVPGTSQVIYSEYTSSNSTLFFYDVDAKTRTKVPGVNTKWYEYNGLASTHYVLFDRDRLVGGIWYTDLLLYDRLVHTTTQLGSWRSARDTVVPGSVGDSTAAYFLIKVKSGNNISFVYDILGASRTQIPVPTNKVAYFPTVDEAGGYVYFSRSGLACGSSVTIRRVPLADPAGTQTVIATLPDGVDAFDLSLVPNPNTIDTDLLFTRYRCSRDNGGDIYALPGVNTF
jgi:hypothetical protein